MKSFKVLFAFFLSFLLITCPSLSYAEVIDLGDPEAGAIGAQDDPIVLDEPVVVQDALPVENEQPEEAVATQNDSGGDVQDIVSNMTLDEKISQMIIVAARTWDGKNVTDLAAVPELAAALRAHQYGGIILFGSNVTANNSQVAALIDALQQNNAQIPGVSKSIPYFVAADQEGGIVARLAGGTRMTGSMAIGATGTKASANAFQTGDIIGEELAALGFNVDFAPSIDVNSNPANPVIGTRAFSDDAQTVATLGPQFVAGLAKHGIIGTYKHFPGHGDTGNDTHIDTAAVFKTIDELRQTELVPFEAAIDAGAQMIMTAHITLPEYDDIQTFANGTKGAYPATMSHKVITELLRGELGYDGVVVTDALEMDAIAKAQVVPGDPRSVECQANIAEKVINAGVDILLLPVDLTNGTVAAAYDAYISELATKVNNGDIDINRINQSVTRILELKKAHGFLDAPKTSGDVSVVGSAEHHAQEMRMAGESITLVKNDDHTLPISGHNKNIVLIGRTKSDNVALEYTVRRLQSEGLVAQDAYVQNLAAGTTAGDESSKTRITIDYNYDTSPAVAHYTDELKEAVLGADVVVAMAKTYSLSALAEGQPQYEGIRQPLDDAHKAGAKFVFVSDNLPYDVARYQDADAILLAYMGTGTDIDPTERHNDQNPGAYGANAIAAFGAVFDDVAPTGTLPVNVPGIAEAFNGTLVYTKALEYERGYGLQYEYLFTEGAGKTHVRGRSGNLAFTNNARYDKLTGVLVDGNEVPADGYEASVGSTNIKLLAPYLNTLDAGEHVITAVYDYGKETPVEVRTSFNIGKSRLVVTARNASIRFGASARSAGVTYEGFVSGDTAKSLSGKLTYTYGGYKKGSPSGTYKITPSGLTSKNYNITYRSGKLSVGLPKSVALSPVTVHIQRWGDKRYGASAKVLGRVGSKKRVEAIQLRIGDQPLAGGIAYRSHLQGTGWEKTWSKDGRRSGTTGQSRRLEAVQIKLYGSMAKKYSVRYRVYVQGKGWTAWKKDGAVAGTTGQSRRVEAMQVRITKR